jgi:hypothetical protein
MTAVTGDGSRAARRELALVTRGDTAMDTTAAGTATVRCEHCDGRGWLPPEGVTVEEARAALLAAILVPTPGMAERLARIEARRARERG